jgi:hypothetical protein
MNIIQIQPCEESGANKSDQKTNPNCRQPRSARYAVLSLEEVAILMGLSRQRVYEIEVIAINKLRHEFIREMPSLELRRDEYGQVCGLSEAYYDSLLQGQPRLPGNLLHP